MDTPYSLVAVDETGSTQDDARAAFVDRPVLVVAAAQSSGRGRSGRGWLTADRAVAISLAFAPEWPREDLPIIPLLAGVAAARVLPVGLKWPNDLLVDDIKVGGILVEADHDVVTVGLGINLWWESPPPDMGGVYLEDPGPGVRQPLAENWARELLSFIGDGPGSWPHDEYRSLCVTLGSPITWEPDGAGIARDIAPDGGLVVDVVGEPSRTLHSGEVRHLRSD